MTDADAGITTPAETGDAVDQAEAPFVETVDQAETPLVETVDQAETPTPETTGEHRRRLRPLLAVVGLAIVVAGAFAVGRTTGTAGNRRAAPDVTRKSLPAGFVTHQDPEAGFSIGYPRTWTRLTPSDNAPRLLLSAGGLNSLLVRVIPLAEAVDERNLADMKSFTDGIVRSTDVKILQERAVRLNGLPGYYYLYAFTDRATGQQGLHAHYFLFDGRTMNTLVFQALPADDFTRLATTFDAVAESFRRPVGSDRHGPSTTAR